MGTYIASTDTSQASQVMKLFRDCSQFSALQYDNMHKETIITVMTKRSGVTDTLHSSTEMTRMLATVGKAVGSEILQTLCS